MPNVDASLTTATKTARDTLLRTIETLERQRHVLGEAAIDAALAPLRAKLASLDERTEATTTLERPSEHKVVSVLFADIAGFTETSERLDSETIADIVKGLFERLVPLIERYGGTVDKFIGNEIMAVFGAPRAADHHVEHALRYRQRRGTSRGGRACRTNPRMTVDVPACRANVRLRDTPAAALKGKSRATLVYRLLGLKPHRAQMPTDGLELAFSGRAKELEALVARAAAGFGARGGAIGARRPSARLRNAPVYRAIDASGAISTSAR